jgi:hypothetical protein
MSSEVSAAPATTLLPKNNIVDVITYTASLSSAQTVVDPLLDALRGITSRKPTPDKLTAEDIQALHSLQKRLEYHLVHEEKMRTFDYPSLHLHIEERFKGSKRASALGLMTAGIVSVAIALGAASYSLPQQPGSDKVLIAVATMYALIYLGAAGLFLQAIHNLTSAARRGYIFLCISMILVTASTFLQPILGIMGLQQHPIAPTIIGAPFIISMLFYYYGCKIIAELSGVRGWLTSSALLCSGLLGALVVSVVLALLIVPYTANTLPPVYAAGAVTAQVVNGFLSFLSAALLYYATRHLTYSYVHAVKALLYAVLGAGVLNAYSAFYWLFFGEITPNSLLWVAIGILVVTANLHLYAGYAFNKMHHY